MGGGIQGLETAWALHQHGKQVIMAEALGRLMPRQIDKRASEILRKAVESFNIKLLLNTQITLTASLYFYFLTYPIIQNPVNRWSGK